MVEASIISGTLRPLLGLVVSNGILLSPILLKRWKVNLGDAPYRFARLRTSQFTVVLMFLSLAWLPIILGWTEVVFDSMFKCVCNLGEETLNHSMWVGTVALSAALAIVVLEKTAPGTLPSWPSQWIHFKFRGCKRKHHDLFLAVLSWILMFAPFLLKGEAILERWDRSDPTTEQKIYRHYAVHAIVVVTCPIIMRALFDVYHGDRLLSTCIRVERQSLRLYGTAWPEATKWQKVSNHCIQYIYYRKSLDQGEALLTNATWELLSQMENLSYRNTTARPNTVPRCSSILEWYETYFPPILDADFLPRNIKHRIEALVAGVRILKIAETSARLSMAVNADDILWTLQELENGGDPRHRLGKGQLGGGINLVEAYQEGTALGECSALGRTEMLKVLLTDRLSLDLNEVNPETGLTPLMLAAKGNHYEVIKLFMRFLKHEEQTVEAITDATNLPTQLSQLITKFQQRHLNLERTSCEGKTAADYGDEFSRQLLSA